MEGGVYWRAAFIRGRRLLEGGVHRVRAEAAFNGGRRLLEGGVYYYGGRRLLEGGVYQRAAFIR